MKIPFFAIIQTWTKQVILKLTAPGCFFVVPLEMTNEVVQMWAVLPLEAQRLLVSELSVNTASNRLPPPAEQLAAALQNFRH